MLDDTVDGFFRAFSEEPNQPLSQCNSIFSDSMMTVAAVEACAPPSGGRLVHHGTIFENKSDSYRRQAASVGRRPAEGNRLNNSQSS